MSANAAAAAACGRAGRPRAHSCSLAVLVACVLGAGAACAPDTITVRSHPHFVPQSITRVAVLPFRAAPKARGGMQTFGSRAAAADESGPGRGARGGRATVPPAPRLAGSPSVAIPPSVHEAIRHMVYSRLKRNPRVHVVSPESVDAGLRDVEADAEDAEDAEDGASRARILGQRLKVDAMLEGTVRVYREREGATFAAIPAAVGFELRLWGGDGDVLWVGEYFEEQKPLTQDARGFFSRGGAFVTAEELARDGVARVLQRLPLGR